jgi:N4-gp56 family major capsid protein
MRATINKFGSLEYRAYGELPLVTAALSEGNTPVETVSTSPTRIVATPVFYGAWTGFTDEVELEAFDPIVSISVARMGEQCGRSVDTLIRNVLTAGATADYAGDATTRLSVDSLTENDIDYADILYQLAALEDASALPIDGDDMIMIIHPFTYATLMQDATFLELFEREVSDSPIRSGYVGRILRCKIFVTNNAREYVDGGTGGVDVYSALFIAKESYGVIGIAGLEPKDVDMQPETGKPLTGQTIKPVEIFVNPVGSARAADPLSQRGTVAWKTAFDAEILNATWIRSLEHANVAS